MGAETNLGVFSESQVINSTEASTKDIDLAMTRHQIGVGVPIYICVRVAIAFTGATSVAIAMENDTDSSYGSAVTFPLRAAIELADGLSTLGYWIYRGTLPYELTETYLQLKYTLVGSETVGAVDAWLSLLPPSDIGANAQVWASNVGNPAAPA